MKFECLEQVSTNIILPLPDYYTTDSLEHESIINSYSSEPHSRMSTHSPRATSISTDVVTCAATPQEIEDGENGSAENGTAGNGTPGRPKRKPVSLWI